MMLSSFTLHTISLTLSETFNTTSYSISYSVTDTDCFSDSPKNLTIAGNETLYTLTGLKKGTEYSITVSASLAGGGTVVDTFAVTTEIVG